MLNFKNLYHSEHFWLPETERPAQIWLKQKGTVLPAVTVKPTGRTGLVWIQGSSTAIRMKFFSVTELCLFHVDFILSDLRPAGRNFHNHLQNSLYVALPQAESCTHSHHSGHEEGNLWVESELTSNTYRISGGVGSNWVNQKMREKLIPT